MKMSLHEHRFDFEATNQAHITYTGYAVLEPTWKFSGNFSFAVGRTTFRGKISGTLVEDPDGKYRFHRATWKQPEQPIHNWFLDAEED